MINFTPREPAIRFLKVLANLTRFVTTTVNFIPRRRLTGNYFVNCFCDVAENTENQVKSTQITVSPRKT